MLQAAHAAHDADAAAHADAGDGDGGGRDAEPPPPRRGDSAAPTAAPSRAPKEWHHLSDEQRAWAPAAAPAQSALRSTAALVDRFSKASYRAPCSMATAAPESKGFFKLDMAGSGFGMCVCGAHRSAHAADGACPGAPPT